MRTQEKADEAFEYALDRRDHHRLAVEIEQRLDEASYGTTIAFRMGEGHPPSARFTSQGDGGKDHRTYAGMAATALIRDADEISLVLSRHCPDCGNRRRAGYDTCGCGGRNGQ